VTAAIGDAAEFLDIDMDQSARGGEFVAVRPGCAHRETGGLVEVMQQRHPVSGQDPADRGAWHVQVVADPMRSPSSCDAQRDDSSFEALWRSGWLVSWPRAQVGHRQSGPVSVCPP
jgi:hypothetical protein